MGYLAPFSLMQKCFSLFFLFVAVVASTGPQTSKEAISDLMKSIPVWKAVLNALPNDWKNLDNNPSSLPGVRGYNISHFDAIHCELVIGSRGEKCFVYVHGTDDILDLAQDLQSALDVSGKDLYGYQVTAGFFDHYLVAKDIIMRELDARNCKEVTPIGYSLGGAVSTILAVDLMNSKYQAKLQRAYSVAAPAPFLKCPKPVNEHRIVMEYMYEGEQFGMDIFSELFPETHIHCSQGLILLDVEFDFKTGDIFQAASGDIVSSKNMKSVNVVVKLSKNGVAKFYDYKFFEMPALLLWAYPRHQLGTYYNALVKYFHTKF